jgi:hypothetical protein
MQKQNKNISNNIMSNIFWFSTGISTTAKPSVTIDTNDRDDAQGVETHATAPDQPPNKLNYSIENLSNDDVEVLFWSIGCC